MRRKSRRHRSGGLVASKLSVLSDGLGPQSLEAVQIYFPDPWHKKRLHKRRLVQLKFINLLAHRVRLGGFCHLATDWAPYAEWMDEIFSQTAAWHNTSENGDFVPRPARLADHQI